MQINADPLVVALSRFMSKSTNVIVPFWIIFRIEAALSLQRGRPPRIVAPIGLNDGRVVRQLFPKKLIHSVGFATGFHENQISEPSARIVGRNM